MKQKVNKNQITKTIIGAGGNKKYLLLFLE